MARKIPLVTGEFYHVFNRGIDNRPIFLDKRDYRRAKEALDFYRFANLQTKLSHLFLLPLEERKRTLAELKKDGQRLVEIISFCFMPNHFHFLLRQNLDGGISKFLGDFTNSFTRYFNTRHNRVGPLFQGVFKAVHIETEEQLLHVSRYIHLNPLVSFVVEEKGFEAFPWSSLPEFLAGKGKICQVEIILSHFKSPVAYKEFVLDHADYAKKLEKIKHLLIEN